MKAIKLTYLLVFALALTFAATGCKKKPVGVTQLPNYPAGKVKDPNTIGLPPGVAVPGDKPPGSENPNGISPLSTINPNDYINDRLPLAADTVHFDFDSSVVKANEKVHVTAVGAYMMANTKDALLIEGYCDERGTEEYNRALGERRALALRQALVQDGVSADRITTRSFGSDDPVDPAHNESAWVKNRRGVFVVLHPK
jgi:peptidoglycan-associated lipoprotein